MDAKFLALYPVLGLARKQKGISLAQRPLVHLAPMVRAGTTAFRALCLDYGADMVWSEEIIDRKLVLCTRRENHMLGTIDFVVPSEGPHRSEMLLFRTHDHEKGRVILQLGTSSADGALAAARLVAADVAGIDVNMGCPKSFSVDNGMGAALLKDQDRAISIVKTLKSGLCIPVTVKVRLLETMEATVTLLRNLQGAGADAVTVHLRRPGDTELTPARDWHTMQELVKAVPDLPLVINGDMYTMQMVRDMVRNSGCAGAMLARPLLLNASVLRADGLLPQVTVMQDFLRHCIRFDIIYQLVKYTLMEMMVMRRHPPSVVATLRKLPPHEMPAHGRLETYWNPVQSSKSLRDLCVLYELAEEYDAAYGPLSDAKAGDLGQNATTRSLKTKRSEADSLAHPSKLEDSYFAPKEKKQALEVDVSNVTGTNVVFRVADISDVAAIVAVTNDAYVADEFFKLPQYYARFTADDVRDMIAGSGVFLVGHVPGEPQKVCASCYIVRTVSVVGPAEQPTGIHAAGNFSAVAVARAYEKRGIGAALIRAAEHYVVTGASEHSALPIVPQTAEIEMGVINLRTDLFKWYSNLGFTRGSEIRPNNAELTRICKPDMDVCCVKMRKTLL